MDLRHVQEQLVVYPTVSPRQLEWNPTLQISTIETTIYSKTLFSYSHPGWSLEKKTILSAPTIGVRE